MRWKALQEAGYIKAGYKAQQGLGSIPHRVLARYQFLIGLLDDVTLSIILAEPANCNGSHSEGILEADLL